MPYYSLNQIMESIVSCVEGHKPIHGETTSIIIYLLEWINIQPHNEFRVFVHMNEIVAISQQHLYSVYEELDNQDNTKIANFIIDYFESTIKNKMMVASQIKRVSN